jgi:hypothetical protein
MTFLNTCEINSMLDYDILDIGTLDITASPLKLAFFITDGEKREARVTQASLINESKAKAYPSR